jgi:ATP-dependent helicase HepA
MYFDPIMLGFLVAHSHMGVGRIEAFEGNSIQVSFFGEGASRCRFNSRALNDGVLKRVRLQAGAWCDGPHGECRTEPEPPRDGGGGLLSYAVRYRDGAVEQVPESQLTPTQQPSCDPLSELVACKTQSYNLFQAREALVETFARTAQEAAGHLALLSSRIDLRPHQAYVAGVTLLDLRRRYIFADEVGLGKTVEAGIVVHDLLMQNPNARVLVVCPGALAYQWLSELYAKFGGYLFQVLDMHDEAKIDLGTSRRAIVSTSRLLDGLADKVERVAWDLVIVDEAHHLLSSPTLYGFAERVAAKAPSLLLLSALPARRRKDEYLRLLRLLEPERYGGPDAAESFDELYGAQPDIGRRLRILSRQIDDLEQHADVTDDVIKAARRLVGSPVIDRDAELVASRSLAGRETAGSCAGAAAGPGGGRLGVRAEAAPRAATALRGSTPLVARIAARSTTFISSRMLPGHACSHRRLMNSAGMGSRWRPVRRPKAFAKCCASTGMSSRRSRSGGSSMGKTLSR